MASDTRFATRWAWVCPNVFYWTVSTIVDN